MIVGVTGADGEGIEGDEIDGDGVAGDGDEGEGVDVAPSRLANPVE